MESYDFVVSEPSSSMGIFSGGESDSNVTMFSGDKGIHYDSIYWYGIIVIVFLGFYYLVFYSDLFGGFRQNVRNFIKRWLSNSYVKNGEIETTKHVSWKDSVGQYILGEDSDDSDSDSDSDYDSDESGEY